MSKCECGVRNYNYKTIKGYEHQAKFDLCFRCGRFNGRGKEVLVREVQDDPYLLMDMIGTGFLIQNN